MKRSAVAVMDTGVNLATNGMSSRAKNRFSATRSDAQTKRQKGTLQTNVPKKFCRHRKDAPLVVTRPFKEDYPEFQEKQWRKRLREAKWGGETDVPARAKADNAHSEELTTAGGHCARVSARNHGDSNDSDLKREKKKKIVSERGPACFKGAGAQIKALVGKEPLKATAPETAADVGSEEFDAQLNEELAAERKRREKQPKKSQKTTSQSNEVSESKDHVSKGFATALETILSRELTTSNGADKSPILSEAPEIYEELSQRKQFGKAERQRRAERKTLRDRPHQPVNIHDAEYERSLKMIATKGVVKLFNAIVQVRKRRMRRGSSSEDEENVSQRVARVKRRREYQKNRQRRSVTGTRKYDSKEKISKRVRRLAKGGYPAPS